MRQSIFLAILASTSTVLSLPIAQSDDDCIGSSFSPTNCGDNSINVDPNVDVSPTVDAGDLGVEGVVDDVTGLVGGILPRQTSDDDCIGSSFSPTNCGDNSLDVSPDLDVSPNVDLGNLGVEGVVDDVTGLAGGAVDDVTGLVGGILPRQTSDDDCIGSSFSPTNCGDNSLDISPDVDASPNVDLGDLDVGGIVGGILS